LLSKLAKLTEIYANAKVNKRSLYKLEETKGHRGSE